MIIQVIDSSQQDVIMESHPKNYYLKFEVKLWWSDEGLLEWSIEKHNKSIHMVNIAEMKQDDKGVARWKKIKTCIKKATFHEGKNDLTS